MSSVFRCKKCNKEVRFREGAWRHRAKCSTCEGPKNIDETIYIKKKLNRICRYCGQPVKLEGDGITQDWKYIHTNPGNCRSELSNGETRVPLKVINTPSGPWDVIELEPLPISPRSITLTHSFRCNHSVCKALNIYNRKGVYIVRSLAQIPMVCHLSLDSAINNIKKRIWTYQQREDKRRNKILSELEKHDNCPVDWCKHHCYGANEHCNAPDLETMEKDKCPYCEKKEEVKNDP